MSFYLHLYLNINLGRVRKSFQLKYSMHSNGRPPTQCQSHLGLWDWIKTKRGKSESLCICIWNVFDLNFGFFVFFVKYISNQTWTSATWAQVEWGPIWPIWLITPRLSRGVLRTCPSFEWTLHNSRWSPCPVREVIHHQ